MAKRHLTGIARAEQEYFLGELDEADERADFIDDTHLLTLDPDLKVKGVGVPVPETTHADGKAAGKSEQTKTCNATGAATDLTEGSTRVITATLKRGSNTVTDDDATVVTFAKKSGTGTITGTGTATVTDGVATKTITAGTDGTIVVKATAPGYPEGTTVSFNVVAP